MTVKIILSPESATTIFLNLSTCFFFDHTLNDISMYRCIEVFIWPLDIPKSIYHLFVYHSYIPIGLLSLSDLHPHYLVIANVYTFCSYAIAGNTKGNMALIDLRKKAMVHIYKGCAGSIRSILCHPTEPIIASCGLDRFLRIHEFHSRNLLHKVSSMLNLFLNYSHPEFRF